MNSTNSNSNSNDRLNAKIDDYVAKTMADLKAQFAAKTEAELAAFPEKIDEARREFSADPERLAWAEVVAELYWSTYAKA